MLIWSALAGKPEGLSFSKIRVPVAVEGVTKLSTAVKGTKFVVIQSLCAVAIVWAIWLPLPSSSFIGKLASKYQVPLACPEIFSGEVIV